MRFLPNGYKLDSDSINGEYKILKAAGNGANTLAYLAEFTDKNGLISEHILKEYYPEKLVSERDPDGSLTVSKTNEIEFAAGKEKFISAVKTQSELRRITALTNQTPPALLYFEANNTVYADIVLFAGDTFDKTEKFSLAERIKVCLATAKLAANYHNTDHLCLDIKPQNIFVISETTDIVEFIDFGSVCRKSDVKNGSFSFTKEWAAPELLNPRNFSKISEKTDMYAIGELAFFSVFERHSRTEEHRGFSEYPFDDKNIRNAVRKPLSELFRNTLRTSVSNRYESDKLLIEQLEKISEELCKKEFIIDSTVRKNHYFIGREAEISALAQKLNDSDILFVQGMGGIGKSTMIREYISRNKNVFDIVLYLYYGGSVRKMITDDMGLQISTFEKSEHENEAEYFERKIRKLRELLNSKTAIIVIDNFDGELDKDFKKLLNLGSKLVVVTRKNIAEKSFETLNIGVINERKNLYSLFENYSGKTVSDANISCLDNIIDKILGHTLVLELIARQVARSYLTISEASALVDKYGFTNIAPEKVDIVKDNAAYHDTIRGIITALFAVDKLSESKQTLLKIISLFGDNGIDIRTLSRLLSIENKDEINELYDDGWININDAVISMHPVIRETVSCVDWTAGAVSTANAVMDKLCGLVQPMEDAYSDDEKEHEITCNSIIKLFSKKLSLADKLEKTKRKKNYYYITLAEQFTASCRKVSELKNSASYSALLAEIIINIPRDRKDLVIENAEEILYGEQLPNVTKIMQIYEKLVTLCLDSKDYDGAEMWLERAKKYIGESGSDYAAGCYFDISARFYDERLDGEYELNNEFDDLGNLLKCTDMSIKLLKKSNEANSKFLLARCTLSKANLLIRSGIGGKSKIRKLLKETEKLLRDKSASNFEMWRDFYLVSAWYHTYIEPDREKAVGNVLNGCAEAAKSFAADLDLIDETIIPSANILFENGLLDESAKLLEIGTAICDLYSGAKPLDSRKADLCTYMLDVYDAAGNDEKYREIEEKLKKIE